MRFQSFVPIPVLLLASVWAVSSAADPRVDDAMIQLMWASSPEYPGCSTVIPSSSTEVDTVHLDGYTLLAVSTGDTWRTRVFSVHSPNGDEILTWQSWMSDVHILIDGHVLYRTDYIAVDSGLTLAAHDLISGELLWETKEHGFWDHGHLSYNNCGAWICLEEDVLVLIGRESHGGYVETVDPMNGEVLERTYLSHADVDAIYVRKGIDRRTGLPMGNKPGVYLGGSSGFRVGRFCRTAVVRGFERERSSFSAGARRKYNQKGLYHFPRGK